MDWLDDSRLSPLNRSRKQIAGPGGRYVDLIFCCHCGDGPFAGVTPEIPTAKYLCSKCEKHGVPPGMAVVEGAPEPTRVPSPEDPR